VVKAKDGTGSATLSMAAAGARFASSLLSATIGSSNQKIVECSYVYSDVAKKDGVEWFSSPVELGKDGVAKIHGLGSLSAFEKKLYEAAIPELQKNIAKGVEFVKKN